jgi:ATP-dependent Clp protease ATP-binding subunit ClpB
MAGEESYEQMKAAVMEVVAEHFRPEFINRIDDLVVFHPLDREQIRRIVDIQLGALRKRLAERDIELQVAGDAMDLLAEAGFDPVYGARPLKRAIQQRLENPLAQAILSGAFGPGDTVETTVADGALTFARARAAAA